MSLRLIGLRCLSQRQYATSAVKPNIKLLAKLRQETEVSMSKAKEALVKNDNDYDKALSWLAQDAQVSGAKKAQKVAGRTAGEGVISVASVTTDGAASKSTIIELNCETDFVSRGDVFKNLASRIAATSLLLHEASSANTLEHIPVESLLQAPLMPQEGSSAAAAAAEEPVGKTIQETIVETIGKLGENITLRRAAIAVVDGGASAAYVHGGDAATGKIGGIATIQPRSKEGLTEQTAEVLAKTARHVARQAVGYNPRYLNAQDVPADELKAQADADAYLAETVLTRQPFLLKPDVTVADYVDQTVKDAGLKDGAIVSNFIRWSVGEGIEKKENDFASEVMKAAQGN